MTPAAELREAVARAIYAAHVERWRKFAAGKMSALAEEAAPWERTDDEERSERIADADAAIAIILEAAARVADEEAEDRDHRAEFVVLGPRAVGVACGRIAAGIRSLGGAAGPSAKETT